MATSSERVARSPRAMGGELGRIVLFAAILVGLSFVTFPFFFSVGIPIDFQVAGVFLAALLLGPVRGTAAVVLFLVIGMAGVPVFDAVSGLETFFASPRVGYYLCYPLAAGLVGWVVHRGASLRDLETVRIRVLVGAMLVGGLVLHIGFVAGYAVTMNVGLGTAIIITAVPFFPAEVVKILVVLGVVRRDLLAPA